MIMELEQLDDERLKALTTLKAYHQRVARNYNRNVRPQVFQEGDLVWKQIQPARSDQRLGKFSPNWEGPYGVSKLLPNGAYRLKFLSGEDLPAPVNGLFLKDYVPQHMECRLRDPCGEPAPENK